MASIVDESGLQVEVAGRPVLTDEQRSRALDLVIVRLRRSGVTFRNIGLILNRPTTTVQARYYKIPAEARRHYESITLG